MTYFLYLRFFGIFVRMKDNSLLRGTLSTLILKLLADNGQMYGYEIIRKIKEASAEQMQITEGALYPALHKLEQSGLLLTDIAGEAVALENTIASAPKEKKQSTHK